MGSIIHHVGLVLLVLWILDSIGWRHPFAFFVSLLYLYKVNERYSERVRKRLQFEERKCAYKRRLLLDSESVRWLNRVVERVWPICMEQIASQQFLLPIIPWFLDNYKPWTAKKAAVQQLYLGRSPPIFTEIRILHEPDGDDDMTLELGMNFLSAEDMVAVLAVQPRKRLGFGMRAKMHVTGMHVEGKVLVGIKFIHHWPFIGRVRICFVEPPYFQMTVKPIFHHGVDVTEIPGIAGWLDKILAIAFEETLVEPNMLVVDVEKFASATSDSWFTMDEKYPIAFAKVEIIEAFDIKPGDISGFADPYVKGQLGPYRFTTKIQKKTLAPKWQEEFKIPISSWEAPNELNIQVWDKDRIFSDALGECWININDYKGGQRHDKLLTLLNTKRGRLHLAITILGENEKDLNRGKGGDVEEQSPRSGLMNQKLSDEFEPSIIEGDQRKGTREHHSGDDISKELKPIKGRVETKLHGEDYECSNSPGSAVSAFSDSSSYTDGDMDGNSKRRGHSIIRRGLRRISNRFHRHSKDEYDRMHDIGEDEGTLFDDGHFKVDQGSCSPDKGGRENHGKAHMQEKAKSIWMQVGNSADNLKESEEEKH